MSMIPDLLAGFRDKAWNDDRVTTIMVNLTDLLMMALQSTLFHGLARVTKAGPWLSWR